MEKYEALKWRWEFMKHNSEYKRDYAEVSKLRNKANYNQIRGAIWERQKGNIGGASGWKKEG